MRLILYVYLFDCREQIVRLGQRQPSDRIELFRDEPVFSRPAQKAQCCSKHQHYALLPISVSGMLQLSQLHPLLLLLLLVVSEQQHAAMLRQQTPPRKHLLLRWR